MIPQKWRVFLLFFVCFVYIVLFSGGFELLCRKLLAPAPLEGITKSRPSNTKPGYT